jgi:hypothetical protein
MFYNYATSLHELQWQYRLWCWYCGMKVKGPIAVSTLHTTHSCFHIKHMAHKPPHTHDELSKCFCNMIKRNSMLKMWINCAPLPPVWVLVYIQTKSSPVWRSVKTDNTACYRNDWVRWLKSKQFRFSQILLYRSVLYARLTTHIFKPSYDDVQLHSDLYKTPLALNLQQQMLRGTWTTGNLHPSFMHFLTDLHIT